MNDLKTVIKKLSKEHDVKNDGNILIVDGNKINLDEYIYTKVNKVTLGESIGYGISQVGGYTPGTETVVYDYEKIKNDIK